MQDASQTARWSRPSLLIGGAAFVVTATFGFTASAQLGYLPTAGADDSQTANEQPIKTGPATTWATRDFPTNSKGQTYGSDAEADSIDQAPDLVAVVGDAGHVGFVLKEDLWLDGVETPEEASAYEERLAAIGPSSLLVYNLDGKVIDRFTPVLGEVNTSPSSVAPE